MQALSTTSFRLLRTSCRFADRRLFLGKAVLYRSHILLMGWSGRGRYERRIDLADVERVGWHGVPAPAPNLVLSLRGGTEVCLHVGGAALWRLTIEGLINKGSVLPRPRRYRHRVLYERAMPMPGGDGAAVSSAFAALQTPDS